MPSATKQIVAKITTVKSRRTRPMFQTRSRATILAGCHEMGSVDVAGGKRLRADLKRLKRETESSRSVGPAPAVAEKTSSRRTGLIVVAVLLLEVAA